MTSEADVRACIIGITSKLSSLTCRAVSPNITKKRKPAEPAAAAPPAKRAAPAYAAAACAAGAEGAADKPRGEQAEPSCSEEAGAKCSSCFYLLSWLVQLKHVWLM